MRHFRIKRIEVITTLSEIAGYKAGLALSRQDIVAHLPNDGDLFSGADDDTLRFGADEFEELNARLLYQLGIIPRPEQELAEFVLWRKYKGNQKKILLVDDISQQFTNFAEKALQSTDGSLDLNHFLWEVIQRYHTPSAFKMALEYVDAWVVYRNSGFDQIFRRVAWADTISLADLFRSESLDTFYGAFFDQRYIDYLYRNFDEIDRINWRKFEGFTAEFFKRSGFTVEIGPGRNDDNVDVRV
jgi:restriction system protein